MSCCTLSKAPLIVFNTLILHWFWLQYFSTFRKHHFVVSHDTVELRKHNRCQHCTWIVQVRFLAKVVLREANYFVPFAYIPTEFSFYKKIMGEGGRVPTVLSWSRECSLGILALQFHNQWRIQDFPGGGVNLQGGGANLNLANFFPKTAWKWKKLDPGVARPWRPNP